MDEYKNLQYALISNDLDKFRHEIKLVSNVNVLNVLGMNILHYYISAAAKLKYDAKVVISLLVGSGIDINAQTKKEKLTPIRYALAHKNDDIFKILLDFNADFELPDNNGNTTLWKAVMTYRGEKEIANIVKMLLDAGADVDRANNHGSTPIHIVTDEGKAIDDGNAEPDWDLRPIFKAAGIDFSDAKRKVTQVVTDQGENKLKLFYWNSYEDKGVSYDNSLSLSAKDAIEYMEMLPDSDGSFLGLILPDKKIVQFIYNDKHELTLDIPDKDRVGSYSKPITLSECLEIIRGVYLGKNPLDIKA